MCLLLYPLSCPSIATVLFLKPPIQLVRLWFSLPTFFPFSHIVIVTVTVTVTVTAAVVVVVVVVTVTVTAVVVAIIIILGGRSDEVGRVCKFSATS